MSENDKSRCNEDNDADLCVTHNENESDLVFRASAKLCHNGELTNFRGS